MSDLISRSALITEIDRQVEELQRDGRKDEAREITLEFVKASKIIINNQPTAYDAEKVEKENEALKLRCCALSRGTMCLYCQLECKHRTEEYRGDGRE